MSLTPIASKKKVVTPAKSKQVRETSTNSSSNDQVAIEIDISASDNQDVKLSTPGAKKIFSNSRCVHFLLSASQTVQERFRCFEGLVFRSFV